MPEEQADPVDTANPSRSSAISSDSASTPSKLMFVVFGTRGDGAPLRAVPPTVARMPRSRRSRSAAIALRLAAQLLPRQPRRRPDAGHAGDVLGAAAAIALVLAAGHGRHQARAPADPQRAGSFRAVELVRRERQQIHAKRAHVDRDLSHRLHRVGVEEGAVLVRDRREVGDRLDRADLVVGVHHRDDGGLARDRRGQRRRGDDAGGVDRQQRGGPPAAGECLDRVQHRLVLDAGRDDVAARRRRGGRLDRFGGAAQRQVVRLGAAAGEHDLGRLAADQLGDGGSRLVEQRLRPLPEVMNARWIAEIFLERARHGFDDQRVWRGGRVVVEVDARDMSSHRCSLQL